MGPTSERVLTRGDDGVCFFFGAGVICGARGTQTGGVKRLKGDVEGLRKALSQAEQQLQQSEQSVEAIRAELRTLTLPPPPKYTKLELKAAALLHRTR